MATCTLTLGADTHTFPLQPGGASISTILEQARAGFAIPHAKVTRPAGSKVASNVLDKFLLTGGANLYLDGDKLYTLKTLKKSQSTEVHSQVYWFEKPNLVVEVPAPASSSLAPAGHAAGLKRPRLLAPDRGGQLPDPRQNVDGQGAQVTSYQLDDD